jgi:FG-GAP-like repeat
MSNPVLGVSASANYTESGAGTTLSSSTTLTDPGITTLVSATLHISAGTFAGDGDVLAGSVVGTSIAMSYDSASETLTLSGVDTLAHYQQVFNGITFASTSHNPTNFSANPARTIDWVVNDGTTTSATQHETVNIATINDAPVLSNVASQAFYGEHAAMVPLSPGTLISDVDNLNLASATVRVSGGTFAGDGDVLAANIAGTSIAASYNSATETLTLTGGDTPAHYQQVLESVTFQSLSNNPGNSGLNTTRTIDWTVDDGSASSSSSTTLHTTLTIGPITVHNDFNGDALSDVLWRSNSGEVVDWTMNGAAISASQDVAASPNSSWSVAGIGNFNGDRDADILWRNTSGEVAVWLMNGSAISASGDAKSGGVAATPDASWSVVGVGDLDGNGNDDVVWRNTSGEVAAWFMNGSTISSSNDITSGGVAVKPDASWSAAGVGDFSGDGKRDILWRNTSGEVAIWSMNGAAINSSADATSGGGAIKPDASWSIAGVGDFNGDGRSDVLWRNSTGALVEWLMNGNTILSSQAIGVSPDSSWNIVEISDFNGDGRSDILWRQSGTGLVSNWAMNGGTISSSQTLGATPDSTWQTQNKPADYG